MNPPPPVAPAAKPIGMARAAKEKEQAAAQAHEQAEAEALRAAQTRKARALKLEQLARRDPAIREVLDENTALRATVEQLRKDVAALKAKP